MTTTGSTTSPFKNIWRKTKDNWFVLRVWTYRIRHYKQDKFKKKITEKTFKAIIGGYANTHMRDTYKMYNPETKRVIMTRDVKGEDCKMTNPEETLRMFCEANKEDLVPGKEEDIIPTS